MQSSEYLLTNFDLEEMLRDENYAQLRTALSGVYPTTHHTVLSLTDPRERGIPVPQPPAKLG